MVVLLDTCVLSEVQKAVPDPTVIRYLARFSTDEMFVSAVSIGEIVFGIEMLSAGRRKRELEFWIRDFEDRYSGRILPVDVLVARFWGEMNAKVRQRGRHVAPADGLIAATALQHGLHVVTRNVKDFEPTGVPIVNPWDEGGLAEG